VLSTLFVGRQLLLRAYDALSQHLLRDALGALQLLHLDAVTT
jgi:hypothetical protein